MTDKHDIEYARSVRITTVLGLKDTRRRLHIRCPFHNDKTASFVIYPDNSYHCFGCAKHGNNAVDFAMELGLTFKQAISDLLGYRYPQT